MLLARLLTSLARCDCGTYLRLDQYEVNKQHDKVMLDVFVGELLAARTLCQSHALAQRSVVGFRVLGVQGFNGIPALYADWHGSPAIGSGMAGVEVGLWSLMYDARVLFALEAGV